MPKLNCPFHEDKTASLEAYGDGFFHCFGCGAHGLNSELPGPHEFEITPKEKYVEDLDAKMAHIKTLPLADIRGLSLPVDDSGYYIVWPDNKFYNYRYFDTTRGKYKCPSGHPKRPYWVNRSEESDTLLVVEGEINALSLKGSKPPHVDIVSPGGAGDFYAKGALKELDNYLMYEIIYLIADADTAGAKACIELKSLLTLAGHKNVNISLWDKDANDILTQESKEALKDRLLKCMGVS